MHVAANRLSRLRKNIAVLAKLSALEALDLRGNVLSLGFYASYTYNSGVISVVGGDGEGEVGTMVEGFDRDGAVMAAGKERDGRYLERLDEDTKLRRRVYEMLLASGCKRLRVLDGMVFDKEAVLVKDGVWERLVELGVLRRSEKT